MEQTFKYLKDVGLEYVEDDQGGCFVKEFDKTEAGIEITFLEKGCLIIDLIVNNEYDRFEQLKTCSSKKFIEYIKILSNLLNELGDVDIENNKIFYKNSNYVMIEKVTSGMMVSHVHYSNKKDEIREIFKFCIIISDNYGAKVGINPNLNK